MDLISDGVKEIELGGIRRKIGVLTLGDFADFEFYVKEQRKDDILATAKKVYGDDIPPEIVDKMITPPTEKEIEAMQGSIEGVAYLLYLALKKFDASLTRANVKEIVTLDDIDMLTKAIVPATKKKSRQKVKRKA